MGKLKDLGNSILVGQCKSKAVLKAPGFSSARDGVAQVQVKSNFLKWFITA